MSTTTRRNFLKTAAAVSVAVPMGVSARALGRDGGVAASERVTMGLIGCGSHGAGWNLDLMLQNPEQQVVAVCDVDHQRLEAACEKANTGYAPRNGAAYRGCQQHRDFRELVNRRDIDAVCIATPDHWHIPLSVFAMKAGKDVICEKPTLTIREGRLLCDVQRATQRVYQTASENRSIDVYQQVVNLARNGHLGKIQHIKVLLPPGNVSDRNPNRGDDPDAVACEVPPHIDYETWLGPAPLKPFVPKRFHYNWRWNFDYSGGVITDWGSHLTNVAQWVLDADATGPVSIQATGEIPPHDDPWNTPANFKVACRYANGVTMDIWTEVPGIKVEGSTGWVLCRGWRQPLRASDEKLLSITFDGEKNFGRPESTVTAASGSGGEHIDFARCVKSRANCYYTPESGHRTHSIAHLANISMLLGGAELNWNPQTETFTGDTATAAAKHFCYQRESRAPWGYDKIDSWINVG
ncbi:MAG: Gfo/Idh/MocA family protein [Thermoguttaceae bacterium]